MLIFGAMFFCSYGIFACFVGTWDGMLWNRTCLNSMVGTQNMGKLTAPVVSVHFQAFSPACLVWVCWVISTRWVPWLPPGVAAADQWEVVFWPDWSPSHDWSPCHDWSLCHGMCYLRLVTQSWDVLDWSPCHGMLRLVTVSWDVLSGVQYKLNKWLWNPECLCIGI